MSIMSSISNAICSVADTVTDIGEAAQKTVSVGTTFVDHRATSFKLTDRETVIINTARTLKTLKSDLESNSELAEIYATLDETIFKQ